MSLSPDRFDGPTPPSGSPEFWTEQARTFAQDLNALADALHTIAEILPRTLQQAADLGLMREQHDMAGVRMVVRGEQELAAMAERRASRADSAIARLQNEVALLRAAVEEQRGRAAVRPTREETPE